MKNNILYTILLCYILPLAGTAQPDPPIIIAEEDSSNLTTLTVCVYDGYEYFNSSTYVPLKDILIARPDNEKYTDTLGRATLDIDKENTNWMLVLKEGFERAQLFVPKKSCNTFADTFEIFLGSPGAYYVYKDGKHIPFDLRENSFAFFVPKKNKSAALSLLPVKYQAAATIHLLDKTTFLIIVDSVPASELRTNILFSQLKQAGAKVTLISKDLKNFITTSFWVQPCSVSSLAQLRDELSNKYPELHIEYEDSFPLTLKITLPPDILLDVFDWTDRINWLEGVIRTTMNINALKFTIDN